MLSFGFTHMASEDVLAQDLKRKTERKTETWLSRTVCTRLILLGLDTSSDTVPIVNILALLVCLLELLRELLLLLGLTLDLLLRGLGGNDLVSSLTLGLITLLLLHLLLLALQTTLQSRLSNGNLLWVPSLLGELLVCWARVGSDVSHVVFRTFLKDASIQRLLLVGLNKLIWNPLKSTDFQIVPRPSLALLSCRIGQGNGLVKGREGENLPS